VERVRDGGGTRRRSYVGGICTAIEHARRSHGEKGKAGGYLDSKAGRVAWVGKLGGSLEERAVARCLDASCRNDRLGRPASDGLYRPRHMAPWPTPIFRSLTGHRSGRPGHTSIGELTASRIDITTAIPPQGDANAGVVQRRCEPIHDLR
jgi:hypothetical protein